MGELLTVIFSILLVYIVIGFFIWMNIILSKQTFSITTKDYFKQFIVIVFCWGFIDIN